MNRFKDDFEDPQDDFTILIDRLERRDLEDRKRTEDLLAAPNAARIGRSEQNEMSITQIMPDTSASGRMRGCAFVRIHGMGRLALKEKILAESMLMEDVLVALPGLDIPFLFLLLASKDQLDIYSGVVAWSDNQDSLKQVLSDRISVLEAAYRSTFPSVEMGRLCRRSDILALTERLSARSTVSGIMTGVPSLKLGTEEIGVEQIEKLVRAMQGSESAYLVVAEPVEDSAVSECSYLVSEETRRAFAQIERTTQVAGRYDTTVSKREMNRLAQYYVELLEGSLERIQAGKRTGMWTVSAYFSAADTRDFLRLKAVLHSAFAGNASIPQPIRTFVPRESNRAIAERLRNFMPLTTPGDPDVGSPLGEVFDRQLATTLNSRELACLAHLPKEEAPGYRVQDVARFSCALPDIPEDAISLGEVFDRGRNINNTFRVPRDEFTKHALVCGVTGSGKTNTCLHLLKELWLEHKIPFLAIEPAKGEYRSLLNVSGFEGMQVFTLGDESTAPFRLNPFDIQPMVPLQSHIDNLKSVFFASFILYAPMPYVLEQCLHEVYEDRGWDLLAGPTAKEGRGETPTLTALYEKVDEVVERLGYEPRISMDVRAGLKARLNSLRLGGKGAMLDTHASLDMRTLFEKPTILELRRIGDDEEKAFLMGLILMRLYEYLEAHGQKPGLQHITLLEEAHRLIKKVSDEGNMESVNTKGKAVETFCNILAEIRAYGEGIFIAEQIPCKLATDAVKNTNLKVMHRLVAMDDRDLMGDSMNMKDNQKRIVSTLSKGEAVVYNEGMHEPCLVRVFDFKGKHLGSGGTIPSDQRISHHMKRFVSGHRELYQPLDTCSLCKEWCRYRSRGKAAAAEKDMQRSFARCVLLLSENPGHLPRQFLALSKFAARKEQLAMDADDLPWLTYCALAHCAESYFSVRKREVSGSINGDSDPKLALMRGFAEWAEARRSSGAHAVPDHLSKFKTQYGEWLNSDAGPFTGCVACKNKCRFLFDAADIVAREDFCGRFDEATRSKEIWTALRDVCSEAAVSLIGTHEPGLIEPLAACCLIQMAHKTNVKNQRKLVSDVFGGR